MQPSSMQSWVMAIRPRTLPAAIGPLLVGNMLAIGLSDFKNGIDTEERIGPVRVTQSGIIEPHHVKNAMIGCLLTALAVGSVLIFHGGWPIAILAIASILGALCYSGGPYPLASHGLGEIAAFVFFGLVAVVGSFYLQAGTTTITAWLLGCAIGFFNAAIMLVNTFQPTLKQAKIPLRFA